LGRRRQKDIMRADEVKKMFAWPRSYRTVAINREQVKSRGENAESGAVGKKSGPTEQVAAGI